MAATVSKSLSEAIDRMKRKQFLKFCKAIDDSTNVKETISTFENKKGYGGKRTLERCSQAAAGFKERLSSEVIAERTGWSVKHVDKIRSWREQEAATEAVIEQKPYEHPHHKQKMCDLAKDLISEISVRSIFITELKAKRLLLAGSRGIRLYPPIIIDKNHKISIELSIDGDGEIGHLYQGLRCHLETGGFSGALREIGNWKKGVGQYLEKCHGLLRVALGEIRGQAKIPNDEVERNEKIGYKLSFFETACADAIEIAMENPPVTDSGYWREALTNNLWLLMRYGGGGIYVAKTELGAKRCQGRHKRLSLTLSKIDQVKETAKLRLGLERTGEEIRTQLRKFSDMQRLPGHCEFC